MTFGHVFLRRCSNLRILDGGLLDAVGGLIDLLNRVPQGLPRREPPVGLDREGEDHGHVRSLGGPRQLLGFSCGYLLCYGVRRFTLI